MASSLSKSSLFLLMWIIIPFTLSTETKGKIGNKIKSNTQLRHSKIKAEQSSIIDSPSMDSNDIFIDKVINIQCTISNCKGTCIDDNTTCLCEVGFTTKKFENRALMKYCSYKQKSQLTAFLLESFFPFGVGHFYAQRISFGLVKLSIVLAPLYLFVIGVCGLFISHKFLSNPNVSTCYWATIGMMIVVGFIWLISDMIFFGLNVYHDGNNVPLKRW